MTSSPRSPSTRTSSRATPTRWRPAQYAATVRTAVPLIKDPDYVPALQRLVEEHDVGAIVPLTDLDIDVLAHARADGRLPQALVPDPHIAEQTYDKYACHELLREHGLPSPPTVLPGEPSRTSFPVMVKPIHGSGARNIFVGRATPARPRSSWTTSTSR